MIYYMAILLSLTSWLSNLGLMKKAAARPISNQTSFYDLSVKGIGGDTLRMNDYKGKYVLCVNVASFCGYTYQYEDLQKLYEQYQDRLVVIGFPCNQFMFQEPDSEAKIQEFCSNTYGVTFPMSAKIYVKGADQHPIYQWLCSRELNGETNHEVKWNFHKFLVSPEGDLIGSFSSKVLPMGEEIVGLLDK